MGPSSEEAIQNARIDAELKQARKELDNEIKILLLGAGESGKSTVAKQMKIIHLSGFSSDEKAAYKNLVFQNVLKAAKTLVEEARARGFQLQDVDAADMIEDVQMNTNHIIYTPELSSAIARTWADPAIKETLNYQSEYQLNDSAPYFLDHCERFHDPSYVPTDLDILRARAKTTGISETEFTVNKRRYRMVDVGGQRNERKKWIHCFQDVTSIIFCAALNEYDMKLEEDSTVNRMQESLKLFGDIINNMWFEQTPIILFLNKRDLFQEKIAKVDLNVCFPMYNGGCNYDAASVYIKKKYMEKNRSKNRKIFDHITCATDTSNIRSIFEAVERILMEIVLRDAVGDLY